MRSAAGALTGSPNWLLFSPDGKTVVSTSLDGTVTLWDVESETPRETLRGHSDSVRQPVFSPDGETLYTVSHDGTAIAWDITGDRGLGRPFTFTHDRDVQHRRLRRPPGEVQPRRRLIAVGLKEEGIRLWDANDLTPGRRAAPEHRGRGQVTCLLAGRKNAGSRRPSSGQATIWDVASQSLRPWPVCRELGRLPCAVSFSPDGKTLATAGPSV